MLLFFYFSLFYFYQLVLTKSTFVDQFRPIPLTSILNATASEVTQTSHCTLYRLAPNCSQTPNMLNKFVTFNCRGLGIKPKRVEIFKWLKREHAGVFFLQETHSSGKNETKWQTDLGKQYKMYYSHGDSGARGVATIIPQNLVRYVIEVTKDNNGRFLILRLNINGKTTCLINVYAPTQDYPKEQNEFLEQYQSYLEMFQDDEILAGGDWNIQLNPKLDKYEGDHTPQTSASKLLAEIITNNNLMDIWRLKNPDNIKFSWRRRNPIRQSRIDLWIIPNTLIYSVDSCEIRPSIRSDHSLVTLILNKPVAQRGKGYWKFNSSLLQDQNYIDRINNLLQQIQEEISAIEDKTLGWEMVKQHVRKNTISYAAFKNKQRREELTKLTEDLKIAEANLSTCEKADLENCSLQYETIKGDWDLYHLTKARGAIIRSKARWAESGEKGTKYFLNLEKHNQERKNITKLTNSSGKTVNSQKEILAELEIFYSNLYNNETNPSTVDLNIFTNQDQIPKINETDKQLIDISISEDECWDAIKELTSGKTPGTDGLGIEFYKTFWPTLKNYFMDSVQYSFQHGQLSIEQRRGMICLIPKGDKDITKIANWRPISLLNSDYKIIAKVLA